MVRRDEWGQIMLLTAILLVIGFVSLSAVVIRVQDIGARTAQVQDAPLLRELDPLGDVVEEIVVAMKANHTQGTAAFDDNLTASLDHLKLLQQQRGHRLQANIVCHATLPLVAHVEIVLQDSTMQLTFRSQETFTRLSC